MKKVLLSLLAIFAAFVGWSQCKPVKISTRMFHYTVTYDTKGNVSKVVDNSDNEYDVLYDESGKVARMNYSEDGEMLEWMIFKDEVVEYWDEDGLYEKYVYDYNDEGLPLKVERQNPDGKVKYTRSFTWSDGNIVEMSLEKPGEAPKINKYQYGADSNPLKVLQPLLEYGIEFGYPEVLSKSSIIVYSLAGQGDNYTPLKLNDSGCTLQKTEGANKKGYITFSY